MITKIPLKRQIAAAFSRKASKYRRSAFIQRRILEKLVGFIESRPSFTLPWLDAGCGAGMLATLLDAKNIPLKLFHTDMAVGALQVVAKQKDTAYAVRSDIEFLPFKPCVFGGVVASSILHWLDTPSVGMREMNRVLVPKGCLVFSVFLKGSFSEIIALRKKRRLSVPVRLCGPGEFLGMMQTAGFRNLQVMTFREEYYFPSARDVLKYISDIGSTAVSGKRLTRQEIISLCLDYEETFKTPQGVPLTCCVAYGIAKKETRPHAKQGKGFFYHGNRNRCRQNICKPGAR